jgi:CYTH domain-containing protein
LAGEEDTFSKPQWLAQEVSLDLRYHNSSLAQSVPS